MGRLFTATITLLLVAVLAASPVLAKTYSFKLSNDCKINGVLLKAGSYKLELNDNSEALIYGGKELVTKASVEVKSRPKGSTSVLTDADHNILEIRTKDKVVVFVR
jgi:hypothetical protein